MALSVKSGSFQTNTGTGNQAITGVGFTPKIVIFFSLMRTSATTGNSGGARLGYGAAVSSTKRWALGNWENDALSPTTCDLRFLTTKCFTLDNNGTVNLEFDFVSQDADGFTVNITTANASGRSIYYLALGGTDLSVDVGTFNSITTTGDQAVTGVGFQPKAMLFFAGKNNTTAGSQQDTRSSIGAGTATAAEWAFTFFGDDAAAPTNEDKRGSTSDVILITSNASVLDAADLKTLDADGFTLDWITNSGTAKIIGYIALGGTIQVKVSTLAQPGSTGNQATTGAGFQPAVVLFASHNAATLGSMVADAHQAIGVGVSSSERSTAMMYSDDANGTASDCAMRASNSLCLTLATGGTPTVDAEADFVSQDSDGFTINWTTVDATARVVGYLAIGAAAAGLDVAQQLPAWRQPIMAGEV